MYSFINVPGKGMICYKEHSRKARATRRNPIPAALAGLELAVFNRLALLLPGDRIKGTYLTAHSVHPEAQL